MQMCPSMRLRSLWYIGRTAKSNLLKRKARSMNHKLPYELMTSSGVSFVLVTSLYAVPCGIYFKLAHVNADCTLSNKSAQLYLQLSLGF